VYLDHYFIFYVFKRLTYHNIWRAQCVRMIIYNQTNKLIFNVISSSQTHTMDQVMLCDAVRFLASTMAASCIEWPWATLLLRHLLAADRTATSNGLSNIQFKVCMSFQLVICILWQNLHYCSVSKIFFFIKNTAKTEILWNIITVFLFG